MHASPRFIILLNLDQYFGCTPLHASFFLKTVFRPVFWMHASPCFIILLYLDQYFECTPLHASLFYSIQTSILDARL